VFELLRDPDRFAQVRVDPDLGIVVWPRAAGPTAMVTAYKDGEWQSERVGTAADGGKTRISATVADVSLGGTADTSAINGSMICSVTAGSNASAAGDHLEDGI
jgi:hypothetical protein